MPNNDLDAIDLKILAELQARARQSNVDLAEGVGAAARRVGDKSIPERSGYYLGYRMAEPYVAENGIAAALRTTRVMHTAAAAALLALGFWMDLSFYYFIGWAIAISLLALENGLLKADDLSKLRSPLFQYNSVISMVLLLFTILAIVL
ncbi:MAG: AsnC family transcriptional regulator [Chloroflexi bacterium]|nr:AsnC family transcriptional regulator [Chloroflexota bacterium]